MSIKILQIVDSKIIPQYMGLIKIFLSTNMHLFFADGTISLLMSFFPFVHIMFKLLLFDLIKVISVIIGDDNDMQLHCNLSHMSAAIFYLNHLLGSILNCVIIKN